MVSYVDKIKVYINTVELSAANYVDGALGHECDQPSQRITQITKYLPKVSSGLISDDERKTIELVEQFSKENGLKYEIIDLVKATLVTKLKFMLKGWRTPVVSFEKEAVVGLPTREQLESLVRRQRA